MNVQELQIFRSIQDRICETLQQPCYPTLPDHQALDEASASIQDCLPERGSGLRKTVDHILHDIVPGLNGSSLSSTYYGFTTGGVTPAARIADNIVTLFDQNVQVHLPNEYVATLVEDRAACLLLQLLDFEPSEWPVRTLTTGATASNITGLAYGREYVILQKLSRDGLKPQQGEGLLSSCVRAGIEKLQVLSALPHSSLGKAANMVGIGSDAMINVSKDDRHLTFDMEKLEKLMSAPKTASIVVISCGEVNTGGFATNSLEEVKTIRNLCDKYGAWLHVDGAFGIFARAVPQEPQYETVRAGAAGLELVDSVASDCHKLLNVPYDCGVLFCRHSSIPKYAFQNTNAVYLAEGSTNSVASPLNLRIENSARFRGLPVYATLISYGRTGYANILRRMIDLARRIASFIHNEMPDLELLPKTRSFDNMDSIYMTVLFRARDDRLNHSLDQKIKSSQKVYASGTIWDGKPAVRFAVAKWDVDVERDFAIVKAVLESLE